jgi:hypothetical protein
MDDFLWYYNHLLPRVDYVLYAYSKARSLPPVFLSLPTSLSLCIFSSVYLLSRVSPSLSASLSLCACLLSFSPSLPLPPSVYFQTLSVH